MFNFKKIASVLSSAVMLSSTVALAAAANYPAPFVKNGGADVAIVYGSTAATTDLTAVIDITANLQAKLAAQTANGDTPGSADVTGEAYALFTSSSPIQINSSINSVRSSVTESNLPMALSDSDFSATSDTTDDSSITASFKVELGSNRVVYAKEPTSNDDPSLGVLLGSNAANYLYNMTATFSKPVNFTDADSKGNALTLFGKKFTIASATDASSLVLFESAEKVFLSSDAPSVEATIGDKTYTVELVSASDTAATIRLTDSLGNSDTEEINEAASKKILGVEVAVDTADETNFKLSASVVLGASRIKLEDTNEVLVGTDETPVEGTQVAFTGPVPDMTKISIAVFSPDGSNDFFQVGDSFADPVFGGFKVDFAGLANDGDREDIAVDVSGNDKMTVGFTNWQGKELSNFAWLNNESTSMLGDASQWPLVVRENGKINESAYAVVGNEDDAYLVRLRTLTNSSGTTGQTSEYTNDKVVFENVFDTSQTWEGDITSEGAGTIDIGGLSYTLSYWDDRDGDNDEYVKLGWSDSSGNDIVAYPVIETSKGAKLMFYEPLTIDLSDADLTGTAKNVTEIRIPDGDGYSTDGSGIQVSILGTDDLNFTVTVGSGTAITINTSSPTAGSGAATGSLGTLKWNVTNVASDNKVKLYLVDPNGGNIVNPAVVLFEEKDEDNNYNAVIVKTGGAGTSDNGVGVSDVDFTWNTDADMSGSAYGAAGLQSETNEDLYSMMDRFGTLVTTDESTSDQYTSVISYPDEQVTAEIYAAEAGATISGSSGGSSSVKELGNVAVMDSQASSVSGKNLIVVGGSCVNSVAASLLGLSASSCGSAWETATGVGAGSFLIQTFSRSNDKVATLVAGYNAGDTVNAAKALTTQVIDTSVGKKYKGTSATSVSLETTATA